MPSLTGVVEVSRATPEEAGLIAPLFDAYRQFYLRPPNEEAARRYLFARLSQGESVVFYATLDSQPAGFVQLYPIFSSLSLQRQWILSDLFVQPEARQKGVAKALMQRAETLACETGADRLILETATHNFTAQRLYESLSWKRETEFYTYYLPIEA